MRKFCRVRRENNWHEHYGDRSQKLVFIGEKEVLPKINSALEACLFTDDELTGSAGYLAKIKDPFGDWNQALQGVNES